MIKADRIAANCPPPEIRVSLSEDDANRLRDMISHISLQNGPLSVTLRQLDDALENAGAVWDVSENPFKTTPELGRGR